ncbi:MAG: phage protein Gp36 family protein [Bacteroidota bacterium]
MAFIDKIDFDQSVHVEILDALTKDDDAKITANINSTIDEMAGYLNGRYDVAAVFAKTGNARNKFLLRIGLSICTYYIYSIHNPRKMTQVIKDNYEKAIEDLEKIQAGKLSPVGLDVPAETDPPATSGDGGPMQWGSEESLGSSY